MKKFLKHRSKRFGYDGWALQMKGSLMPMAWTVCTTRKEVRELLEEERNWIRPDIEIVKVRIVVEAVNSQRVPE
jgi:hypothetical protein